MVSFCGSSPTRTTRHCDPAIQVDERSIVLDGRGEPAAIIKTAKVEQSPFLEGTPQFAAAVQCETFELVWPKPTQQ